MMIHIITPLSRPENFNKILSNIPLNEELRWEVIIDGRVSQKEKQDFSCSNSNVFLHYSPISNSFVGHSQRNWALKSVLIDKNSWVYFLDDDNILHPDFLKEITFCIKNCDKTVIVFNQILRKGEIRLVADINHLKIGFIDTGQFILNVSKLPKDIFFKEDVYFADGLFIEDLVKKIGVQEFEILNKNLSYYNYLK